MSLSTCPVVACKSQKPGRFVLCGSCWDKVPKNLQMDTRRGTEKGMHSLKAAPTRDWFERVMQFVGHIKIPLILGSGHSAVKVASDRRNVMAG